MIYVDMEDSAATLLPGSGHQADSRSPSIMNGPKQYLDIPYIDEPSTTPTSPEGTAKGADVPDRNEQIIKLNVGGRPFHTTRQTISRWPGTRLYRLSEMDMNYNDSTKEWFFDRDPVHFNNILDFYRTGELHFPHNVCGPSIKKELDYWQIQEGYIDACCWNRYQEFEEEKKIYDKIDQAFESKTLSEATRFSEHEMPSKWMVWQQRLYIFLEEPMSSQPAKIWALFFLCLVLTSIAILCIETHPSLRVAKTHEAESEPLTNLTDAMTTASLNMTTATTAATTRKMKAFKTIAYDVNNKKQELLFNTEPHPILEGIDSFCTCFFTVEFFARLTVAPSKLNFLKNVMNIIDVLCVLPMWIKYLLQIYQINLQGSVIGLYFVIMALRVLRICRVLRMARHYTGVKILVLALSASSRELGMLLIFITISMLVFAVCIYYAEFGVPDTFGSIPEGFWWVIITLTTVGYGDMFPKSLPGYVVGSLCALAGILATGLPVPIIANNFNLYYTHAQLKDAIASRRAVTPVKATESAFNRIGSKKRRNSSIPAAITATSGDKTSSV